MLSHLQEVVKQSEIFVFCQHALDPGSHCALTLLTNADLKADITLFISKKSCLFNILIGLGRGNMTEAKGF